jgi:hypothetical protein
VPDVGDGESTPVAELKVHTPLPSTMPVVGGAGSAHALK